MISRTLLPRNRQILYWFFVFSAVFGIAACSTENLGVKGVRLTHDDGEGKPGATVTSYRPTDGTLHVVADLSDWAPMLDGGQVGVDGGRRGGRKKQDYHRGLQDSHCRELHNGPGEFKVIGQVWFSRAYKGRMW